MTVQEVRRCINCPGAATLALRLRSGTLAWLCEECHAGLPHHQVYFIRSGELVKIGYSRDVARRLRALRTGSPAPLELWHTVEGTRDHEAMLHRKFDRDHSHGEWFRVSDDIRRFVERAK